MFGNSVKIRIDKQLWAKLKKLSELAGYASVDEFVIHALEKEVSEIDEAESDEEIRQKLRGLGYIS
jgi:metal-responsive CopG/Arc/MetJ family transcriptional regulator